MLSNEEEGLDSLPYCFYISAEEVFEYSQTSFVINHHVNSFLATMETETPAETGHFLQ
jgi:hypothetical protein